ncbi:hypothetical protein MYCTH_2123911 [Thermothelomyces thermophilus ATCC 42464]|uniref:Uncharacterized protein n=1 Tax=Thermothelomyces thermophilus (strain ATCC 42464 / BCRC 31852 / DSM 1799) TaxID=573729 RepID=G2Q1J2_THET4|nr:uncharacterized protein MYCTH_2123911 [Thermothelomyces thermophilus ATCC 42464]AEO54983.1 hypothetical protein MYCTH_2123911 [Thermothelomyces thermophilus ATCC 42464]
MCDYKQREFSCGHFRWLATKHCAMYKRKTGAKSRCLPEITAFEERYGTGPPGHADQPAAVPSVGHREWSLKGSEIQFSPAHRPGSTHSSTHPRNSTQLPSSAGVHHSAGVPEVPLHLRRTGDARKRLSILNSAWDSLHTLRTAHARRGALEAPMPIMTKLPADPFRPKGAPDGSDITVSLPKLTGDSSASIISPLSLPRGAAGYFDHIASKDALPTQHAPAPQHPRRSQLYSPLSPGLKRPALHTSSFLSPQLLPSTKCPPSHFDQHRSTSLPPETRNSFAPNRFSGDRSHPQQDMPTDSSTNGLTPTVSGTGNFASPGCPQSIPADPVAPTCHDQLVQRLLRQKARLLEAWEAERKYLEANRERAEEVYKEERALMEEERAEWEAEKAILLAEIERLGGVNPLASTSARPWSRNLLTGYGGYGGARGASRVVSPNSTQRVTRNGAPTHSNGTSTIPPPMVGRAPDLASPRSPNGPSAPTKDFLNPDKGSADEANPVPIVDVMEIDPELEGIRIKATSVKKPTFTDTGSRNGSKPSSQSGSPPSGSDQSKSPRAKKEQTLQVLEAEEAERLTMHAGHTPNHSLSTLATVVSSGTATATSNGGRSTPTTTLAPHNGSGAAEPGANTDAQPLADDHPEPLFDPSEDRELKGPLMVRNMPAHDEIFFQKLNDKLEEVSKDGVAALPAVLKEDPDLAEEAEQQPAAEQRPETQAAAEAQAKTGPGSGSDTASEAASRTSPKSSDGDDDDEELDDVPLKLKKRMNFGAPFGEIR